MMKDFTLSPYKQLLQELQKNNCKFLTLEEYFTSPNHLFNRSPNQPFVILRHDVDRKPQNSLKTAIIENKFNMKASYYFRVGKESNQPEIIEQIEKLGHEIGYHYEDLATAKGDYEKAIKQFENNLNYLRKFYPIKTICMHGSPLSKWDNRDLWNKYNYHDFGIIGEPYFDIDFNEVLYITDAGRSWNNENVSIRDKVKSQFEISINSTKDIIELFNSEDVPNQIMISIHPHNWANNNIEWLKILLWQGSKNLVKRSINRIIR